MNEKDFTAKIREICDNETATMDSALAELDGWDSLGIVSFVAFANASCGKKIPPADIRECKTVRDLYGLVSE